MEKMNFKQKWVAVTGASSGLGREIALYLSKIEKANIILIARRTERLKELKEKIEKETKSKVKLLTMDLSRDGSGQELFDFCTKEEEIYAIINNAGLTVYEVANAANLETYKTIINLNFKTPVDISLLFLDYFKKKKNWRDPECKQYGRFNAFTISGSLQFFKTWIIGIYICNNW